MLRTFGVQVEATWATHSSVSRHSFTPPGFSKRVCWGCIGVIWGFPEIRGTILGVPIMRIIVFGGLYWGTLVLENHHIGYNILGLYRDNGNQNGNYYSI